jgi:hypothetical protein
MIMTDPGYFKKLNLIQIIGFSPFFGRVLIRNCRLKEEIDLCLLFRKIVDFDMRISVVSTPRFLWSRILSVGLAGIHNFCVFIQEYKNSIVNVTLSYTLG